MSLSKDEIAHIAHLSRLAMDDATLERLGGDLNAIVQYVDVLNEVDTDGVEPMSHAVPMTLRSRADERTETLGRDALKNSAGYEDGLVKVPKIVD